MITSITREAIGDQVAKVLICLAKHYEGRDHVTWPKNCPRCEYSTFCETLMVFIPEQVRKGK